MHTFMGWVSKGQRAICLAGAMVIVAALLGLSGMIVQSTLERATAEAGATHSPAPTYRLTSL